MQPLTNPEKATVVYSHVVRQQYYDRSLSRYLHLAYLTRILSQLASLYVHVYEWVSNVPFYSFYATIADQDRRLCWSCHHISSISRTPLPQKQNEAVLMPKDSSLKLCRLLKMTRLLPGPPSPAHRDK